MSCSVMSTQNSPSPRPVSRKRSFIKKVIPKFLRRSRKHSSASRERRSFVVDDDSSGDNWSVDENLLGAVCQENKVHRVHVSPTKHLGTGRTIENLSTHSAEVANNHHNAIREQEENRRTHSLQELEKRLDSEDQPLLVTPTAPPPEEIDVESSSPDPEVQGHSCVGTIQIKLAPHDFVSNDDYEDVMKTLLPKNTEISHPDGIYDFPMFGDESMIRNGELPSDVIVSHDDHVTQRSRKYVAPTIAGWGMVILNEGSHDFSLDQSYIEDRSYFEDMLLSSSTDGAMRYRHMEEEDGWGMVYTPDDITVSWIFKPIKDIFRAFWDLLSIVLISTIFMITGTAVTLVVIWQTIFTVIDTITTISKWATTVGHWKKRTKPYSAPVNLPTSGDLRIENPFKKFFEHLLKPFMALLFIALAPIFIIDGFVQKVRHRHQERASIPYQLNTRNFLDRLFTFPRLRKLKLPHIPKIKWSLPRGRTSAPVRMGSVWGRHSGGSRTCTCRCRRGKCTIS